MYSAFLELMIKFKMGTKKNITKNKWTVITRNEKYALSRWEGERDSANIHSEWVTSQPKEMSLNINEQNITDLSGFPFISNQYTTKKRIKLLKNEQFFDL